MSTEPVIAPPDATPAADVAVERFIQPGRQRDELLVRPHGGMLMTIGALLLFAGAIALVVGLFASEIETPGSPGIGDYLAAIPPTYNSWKWPATWLGAGALNLGLLLWVIGHIVRAVFFLPGRDVTAGETWPK